MNTVNTIDPVASPPAFPLVSPLASPVAAPLRAFGLLLSAEAPDDFVDALPADWLQRAVLQHRVVVLRGFRTMTAQRFTAFCRRFGELLEWDFGVLLDLKMEQRPANHLFSGGRVELHWDGAFARQTPRFNLFQCLAAAADTPGGATLFADTTAVLAGAGEEERARWSGTRIAYSTAKKAHYGGAIEADLVATHPTTGVPVLRFIESYNEDNQEVNPVSAGVAGRGEEEVAGLFQELLGRLYDPRYLYRHQWQAGDVVLVDNHAVLHGRERIEGNVTRHLQRIHVL